MFPERNEVDFLIVTALPVETEAVAFHIEDQHRNRGDILGRVSRNGSPAKYSIALTEIGESGTVPAQGVVSEALIRRSPKRVILTGIAAGFPEANVQLGDVLVPYFVVPYEPAKVAERASDGTELRKVEIEHRGLPLHVSHPLWRSANSLGADTIDTWVDGIRLPRPDGSKGRPLVHSSGRSVLGSGEKVIATDLAEARKWLLTSFPGALGMEMESYGVLWTCQITETPVLVVKAVQDTGTADKDDPIKKDKWRAYAAQAAAAFTIALVRRFELETTSLLVEHMKSAKQISSIFARDGPIPSFRYHVRRADSYGQLRQGIYSGGPQEVTVLVPSEVTPKVALHGGGGTGKTTIVRSIFSLLIDSGLCPVMLELKRYESEPSPAGDSTFQRAAFIQEALLAGGMPRRTQAELEHLAKSAKLVAIVDGLNEISREARMTLLDYFRELHKIGTCYILVTDRFGLAESMESFSHAVVERLDPVTIRTSFDGAFGPGSYDQLGGQLQRIYTRPFFLSLALKTRRKFQGKTVWSGIFEEFFTTQLGVTKERLDVIAHATLHAFHNDGSFDGAKFGTSMPGQDYEMLIGADVVSRDEGGFEHHLWRDYLVSRSLALQGLKWEDRTLDSITSFASSLECLSLTLEQLANQVLKDTFLKMVFDWNYVAAADCIADFKETDPEPRQVSPEIRVSILAAIAEKRFDSVRRTRERADSVLRNHQYDQARPFIEAIDRHAIVKHIDGLPSRTPWFMTWKALFAKRSGDTITASDVGSIASSDSLIGWAAANMARRVKLSEDMQAGIRQIYAEAKTKIGAKSVRWRAVHALGTYPTRLNADMLLEVLANDEYHWAKYGAARALTEIAARAGDELRLLVLSGLADFIGGFEPQNVWVRRLVLREIVETAFIDDAVQGWEDAAGPVLELVVQREDDPSYSDELRKRLEAFEKKPA